MRIALLALVLSICFAASAQTAAGNAFRIDYDEYQVASNVKYLDAGNSAAFNTGDELTVMTWVQMRDMGDNQKLIGKFNLDQSGYVLAVAQAAIYAEVWNPEHYEPVNGQMNPTLQHWFHLAMTYTRGDALRTYINGIEVGSVPVTDAPIVASDNPVIIGVSSWLTLDAFQGFGNYDETAIFNTALSPSVIQDYMYRGLTGEETGLVAAWNYNIDTGTSAPDISGNGNTAQGSATFVGTEWVTSEAPMADAHTGAALDLNGIWNGKSVMDPRFTLGTTGLNLLASGMDTTDYVVFGHNAATGTTADDLPSDAPAGFVRSQRVFPATANGDASMSAIFALTAGGEELLDDGQPASHYTMLYRPAGESTFGAIANAVSINSGNVRFDDIVFQSGDYAIGVASAPFPVSVTEFDLGEAFVLSPNPSDGIFDLTLSRGVALHAQVDILDITGKVILSETLHLDGAARSAQFDISNQGRGIYLVRVQSDRGAHTERVTVR